MFTYLLLDIDQSLLAVSLTYVLMISGSFQWCIRQSAEVDNLVSAINQLRFTCSKSTIQTQEKGVKYVQI